jgi:2-amino-4-hydroxy-6-hydroxymethyldihydropteridine diphosphokinase
MEAGISLGSNLGDRLANLARARDLIAAIPGARVVAASRVWETEPVDVLPRHRDKPFLNAVLVVESGLTPQALAAEMGRIESEMGRVRTADRNAPRVVDLDLLYAGRLRVDGPGLTVPHPRWSSRRFVVQPLCDVRPDLVLPGASGPVREALLALPDSPKVVLFRERW